MELENNSAIINRDFITYHNKNASRYHIINIKVKNLNTIFDFYEIHSRIIDWLDLSFSQSVYKKLNLNIGICYPEYFILTNENLFISNKKILDTKIIKIFLYLNNTNNYDLDIYTLLYNNIPNNNEKNNINTTELSKCLTSNNIFNNSIDESFNIPSILLLENKYNFIDSLSISAVCYDLFEIELKKYNNRFTLFNLQNNMSEPENQFYYYKNIKYNFSYKFEEVVNTIDNYLNNIIH